MQTTIMHAAVVASESQTKPTVRVEIDGSVGEGEALDTADGLPKRIAENSPVSNYAILQALPRIAEMGPEEGLFVESIMSAVSQSSDEAKALRDFLAGRASKVASESNESNGSGPAADGGEAGS